MNQRHRTTLWGRVQLLAGLAVISLLMLACGCIGGFTPPAVIAHPDAPYLISEVKGRGYARVFLYDKATNRLIEMGWVDLTQLTGRTANKFNWEKFIESREKKATPTSIETGLRQVGR